MPMLAAAPAAIALVSGIIGANSAKKGRKQAAAASAAAYAELTKIGMPPDLSKEIILKQFQSEGILTPELEQEINLQSSQVAQIKEDPSLRNDQMDVLNTLGGVSRGGLRTEDRAAYNELRSKVQQDAEAKRQQILQSMQARGQSGSGNELMAQLQSAQASADTASSGADNLAAEASRRALEALSQRANLAGSVRTQDASADEMRARAIDDRNQFLYRNSVDRQRQNIGNKNTAQADNLTNAQNLSNKNTAQANEESLRQSQAKRDYFDDQFRLATAKANALNQQGSMAQSAGQAKANSYSSLGNALAQGVAAYGNYKAAAPTATAAPQGTGYDFLNPNGTRMA